MAAATAARRPVAFAKRLTDAAEFLLPDPTASPALNEAAAAALAADKSTTATIDGEPWFIEARNPAPRLILIGAVHIAQALVPLAAMAGFAVLLVDPRRAFATAERFPNATLNHDWPDAALAALAPDTRTAIVTLTHDPKLDDPALNIALGTPAFYIGALGSRKTHAARPPRPPRRPRPHRPGTGAHPRPGRAAHWRRHRAGNRPVGDRRDRRRPPRRRPRATGRNRLTGVLDKHEPARLIAITPAQPEVS